MSYKRTVVRIVDMRDGEPITQTYTINPTDDGLIEMSCNSGGYLLIEMIKCCRKELECIREVKKQPGVSIHNLKYYDSSIVCLEKTIRDLKKNLEEWFNQI